MAKRMTVPRRKAFLLGHALKLAERHGYAHISRKQIGEAAGVSEGLLSRHFGTMAQFREALMSHAIETKNAKVVAQGLVARDRLARKAPWDLKQLALASVAT